ncbi:MAG: LppA family lipoprotein [Pseudonocardiaceae bacterium]
MRLGPADARSILAATLATITAFLVACGGGERSGDEMADRQAELAQRPSSEDIAARYEEMSQRIVERLSAELGGIQFAKRDDGRSVECGGDFSDLGGEVRYLDRWLAQGTIPESQWDQAAMIVAEMTSEYGFGEPNVIVDRQGDHQITGLDPYAASYRFGTAANTLLSVTTGCHPPSDQTPVSP